MKYIPVDWILNEVYAYGINKDFGSKLLEGYQLKKKSEKWQGDEKNTNLSKKRV